MRKLSVIVLFLVLAVSCKKDPITQSTNNNDTGFVQTNSVDFQITNMVGSMPLALNTQTYINENLDTFSVSLFKYYISNIKLKRDDGYEFVEPESYRLIKQNDSTSLSFSIPNVPLGNYISMEFIIGVDSLRNCSGAQTGALDPIHDMFWDWAQGYIFAKMEGSCNASPFGNFFQHIGGFTGQWNTIVKSSPSFGTNLIQVVSDKVPKVMMKTDILEWFKNPSTIDLAGYSSVAIGKKAHEIALNYADMISVTAIVN